MIKIGKIFPVLLLLVFFFSCSKDDSGFQDEDSEEIVEEEEEEEDDEVDEDEEPPTYVVESEDPMEGIRIAWDYHSLRPISEANISGYNGYPRLIELNDHSLLVAYESKGNVVVKKSNDQGYTWGSAITVASFKNGVNMATPDLIQLEDNSILVSYNPRPTDNADASEKFAIRTVRSLDGGNTWQDDQMVYEATNNFADGVWEPSAVQLPNGEVQLFFSNEGIYRTSGEQNISLLRSQDNGITWTETPEIASFTQGRRDGMPSPLLLDNGNEIVFAIEDNSENNQFKPYIIRNTIEENWEETVTGDSPNRTYALSEELDPAVYAGAPYLAQLSTGETLLSYQGTEGRQTNNLSDADMKVVIGNERAMEFGRKTIPFDIPTGKSALWSSIAVTEDDMIFALTTTNAFSNSNSAEVWMIKGRVIRDVEVESGTLNMDGATGEAIWEEDFPLFIGHQGEAQLQSHVTYDNEYLYILNDVRDSQISTSSSNPYNNDAVALFLDPKNNSYVAPGPEVFKVVVSADNKVAVYEGGDSEWEETEISADGLESRSVITTDGYVQEVAIPWDLIGGKPDLNTRIGLTLELVERGREHYRESISLSSVERPSSWLTLRLKN